MIIQGKVWGKTSPIFNKNNVELHVIAIEKGGFCSNHCHKHKFNKFVVLNGKLKVTITKDYGLHDVTILEAGQECTVAPGEFHKFEALERTEALELYWVELNEKDIVRVDVGGILHEAATSISDGVGKQDADKKCEKENGSDGRFVRIRDCDCKKPGCVDCWAEEYHGRKNVSPSHDRFAIGFYDHGTD